MTTIAYRDGVMAADSVSVYGGRKHQCVKLHRKTGGEGRRKHDVIIGVAGELYPAMLFVDWYGTGNPVPEMLRTQGGEFVALILTPKGLFEADIYCRITPVEDTIYAIGSGGDLALGAMAAGKSATEAVRIAARYDAYTGGRVVSMTLDLPESKRKAAHKGG